jgi:hypothetical protein
MQKYNDKTVVKVIARLQQDPASSARASYFAYTSKQIHIQTKNGYICICGKGKADAKAVQAPASLVCVMCT